MALAVILTFLVLAQSAEPNSRIDLTIRECPSQQVTVFSDRAELTRLVEVNVPTGDTEIRISGFSDALSRDSIRVNPKDSKITINEVVHGIDFLQPLEDPPHITALKEKLATLQEEHEAIKAELESITNEQVWLKNFAATIGAVPGTAKDVDTKFLMTEGHLTNVAQFLSFYRRESLSLATRHSKVQKAEVEKITEIGKIQASLQTHHNAGADTVNQISVFVTSLEAKKISLSLSYILIGPRWTPSYDVRVDSDDNLDLTYFGNIVNPSGEDFIDVELFLSTATPSVAGKPPTLYGKVVDYKRHQPQWQNHARYFKESQNLAYAGNMAPSAAADQRRGGGGSRFQYESAEDEMEEMLEDVMTSTKLMTSYVFSIPKKTNILSDSKPHKVKIETRSMPVYYSYTILPISSSAYLRATITNDATFPFLAGNVNVFMNNNFVSKSHLDLLNPSESTGLFLGVDANIKVEHQELKNVKDTTGLFTKSNTQTVHLNTVVRNMKEKEINVTVFHQLPRSNNGEIKVNLQHPKLIEEHPNIRLTASNNVEVKATLKPGKAQFPFNYVVEFPVGHEIDFTDVSV